MDRREWIYSEKQIPELVIIPKSAWEKAQEIREERIRKLNTSKEQSLKLYEDQYKVPFTTRGKLALMGLVYCGYCGKKLKNGSYCNHWTVKSGKRKFPLQADTSVRINAWSAKVTGRIIWKALYSRWPQRV